MINLKLVLIILFAEMWGVGGQLLYKTGVNKAGTPDLRDHRSYVSFIKRIVGIPQIWLGFISVVIGMCVWLTALAQADLSIAFPIDSMQYIITMVAAHYLLGEKINKMKLLGTLVVMCGVIIVAMS